MGIAQRSGSSRQAARELALGNFDVVLFTSSIQLEHLLQIALEENCRDEVLKSIRDDVAVASVGPIMSATLLEHGLTPDIVPFSPKMGALVKAAAEGLDSALRQAESISMTAILVA